MSTRNIAVFIAILFLTSCAQVPKEESYHLSYQKKMQASEHWNELAKKIAEDVRLKTGDRKIQVFMSDVDRSPFRNAMRTLLAAELHHRDVVLTADESSPYKLDLKVQEVFHSAVRRNSIFGSLLSFLLLDIPQSVFLGETDFSKKKPHSEVIVTYALLKNEHSLLRNNAIFYINDADRAHYWETPQIEVATVRYSMKDK
jgi:hypothetical protein